MFYVYYLRSLTDCTKTYVGFTHDVQQRLAEHNSGKSIYTSQFKPWTLLAYFAFDQEDNARAFERYLKTNAGKIFLKRHAE
ncbi:MAG: GIY-YIG nuclease family protein [Candidatus Chromulinivorax sp.]|nr:GIY-YIG nuclease family protein [Candidatus Chromulinivorax sp.]